jgi:hypothetical protein
LLCQTLADPAFIASHRQREQDFTRQRALPFATVVSWLLLNFQNSMRQALQRLFDARPGGGIAATQGAISQARAKLKDTALVAPNGPVVSQAEAALPLARWMGLQAGGLTKRHCMDACFLSDGRRPSPPSMRPCSGSRQVRPPTWASSRLNLVGGIGIVHDTPSMPQARFQEGHGGIPARMAV